jgi:hypothetical protein
LRISIFITAFLLLTLAAYLVNGQIVPRDIFAKGSEEQLRRIALLPEFDLAAAKLNHASMAANVDVGLFGNSRIVSISSKHLALDQQTVFNFAVPGTSMRQSTALLEELAEQNRLPKIALISMDNFALQYYGNAFFPGWWGRLNIALDDVKWSLGRAPTEIKMHAHTILDHVYAEWRHFTGSWSATKLWARAAVAAPNTVPTVAKFAYRYRPDGSREIPASAALPHEARKSAKEFVLDRPVNLTLMPQHLRRDLKRLAALSKRGVKIVIFETHVHPDTQSAFAQHPNPHIRELRSEFLASCTDAKLSCYTADDLPLMEADPGASWPDCCHAPAAALGRVLAGLVRKHFPG